MLRANWLYFLGTNQNPTEVFVYGLSLPTTQVLEFSLNPQKIGQTIDGKRLFLYKSIKKVDQFLYGDKIDLTQFYEKDIRKTLPVVFERDFIQSHKECSIDEDIESPINSLVNIKSYYSKEVLEHKFDKDSLLQLLKTLERCTNQKFYGNYVKRLGCFEVGQIQPWAESVLPFELNKDKKTGKYAFHKLSEFNQDVSVVIKIYHSSKEKMFERLMFVPKDKNDVEFDLCVNGSNWGHRYYVYDTKGELLHEDLCIYIGEISLSMSCVGRGIKISDKFSQKDSKLSIISKPLMGSTSVIKDPFEDKNYADIKKAHNDIAELVKDDQISSNEGMWFKKSDTIISKVVGYLNTIISGADEVVIVDPYTDGDMMPLVVRMNAEIITVIASKNSFSNEMLEFYKDKILAYKNRVQEYGMGLDSSKFFFVSKAFHDRFIMIKKRGESLVYCLPNSINSMLKNDDFLVLKLNGRVKIQAMEHIESLAELCTDDCLVKAAK